MKRPGWNAPLEETACQRELLGRRGRRMRQQEVRKSQL
jgi:hypothetical protein